MKKTNIDPNESKGNFEKITKDFIESTTDKNWYSSMIHGYNATFRDDISLSGVYLNTIDKLLTSQMNKEYEPLEKHAAKLPKHKQDEFWLNNLPYWWDMIFEEHLYISYLVSLFIFLEKYLSSIYECFELLTRDRNNYPDPKKNNRAKLKEIKNFLTKRIHKDFDIPEWEDLFSLWRIRNVCAHRAGLFDENTLSKLKKFRHAQDWLTFQNGYISLDLHACQQIRHIIENFGFKLDDIATKHAERIEKEYYAK